MSIILSGMTDKRIIDLSEEPAALSVRYDQLIIKHPDRTHSVPLEDLAVLILSNPVINCTQAVLAGICAESGTIIICNEKRLPVGLLMPLADNSVQAERFAAQAAVQLPTKKRIWMQIIKAKIIAQGELLKSLKGDDHGLVVMTKKVRSGDPNNFEAQASRRYWPALFGDSFRRIPGSNDGINRLLNYGYAIMRGIVCRAICASGLHPTLGVHHHNRYNPFCLADDLMEPLRPLADRAVWRAIDIWGPDTPLNNDAKKVLLENIMNANLLIGKESRNIFDAISRYSSSLASVYLGNCRKLMIPAINYD
nr:type II CRISPR-associated endonuclease Cas1 [candidate division Zixibacteria bacterium]